MTDGQMRWSSFPVYVDALYGLTMVKSYVYATISEEEERQEPTEAEKETGPGRIILRHGLKSVWVRLLS